jgi:hypothetical protein
MDRMTVTTPIKDRDQPGSAFEVLLAFAKLGVSCFGGPIAHIGYFRQEFVVRRRWLDERPYADLVALCQFLPGPASSQVGFSLGLMRAGYLGGLAAWVACALRLRRERPRGRDRFRSPSRSQAGGRRNRGPSGVGYGTHALSRSGARFDRGRSSIDHPVELVFGRSDRGHRLRWYGWPLALPCRRSDTLRSRAYVSARLSAGGPPCARRVLPASRRAAHSQ